MRLGNMLTELLIAAMLAALSLLLLIATFAFAIRCLRNFDKGLKQHLHSHHARRPTHTLTDMHLNLSSAATSTDTLASTTKSPIQSYTTVRLPPRVVELASGVRIGRII